ncbi:MAG: deoxyribonuclease IV [Planctomycetaceae bacterium]|nr:deoxyribonuclease IV [Planctomycetaceae bacterium]
MNDKPLLGAHESIAGGYYKSVEIAARVGCDCVQLFTKNNNQWRAKEISADEAAAFREALGRLKISHPIAHDSYLINLAAPDDDLWKKSIEAFIVELRRADQLGIPYVVTHPGSFTTTSEAEGLKRIIAALDIVHKQTAGVKACCLLENTAGQGSNLGNRFEHLAAIIAGVKQPERLGVCIDTCHAFAAGYPIADPADYEQTFAELDRLVGLGRVKAFHLNDSKKGLGSRVDRHEHIGEGMIGIEAFRNLLNDPRFRQTPMYLETPKGTRDDEDLDTINLRTLRSLVGPSAPPAKKKAAQRK